MKKFTILVMAVLIFIVILNGYITKNTTSELSSSFESLEEDMSSKLNDLENQLTERDKEIKKLEQKLLEKDGTIYNLKDQFQTDYDFTTELYNHLSAEVSRTNQLVYNMPALERKHVYVNEMEEDETGVTFYVDEVEWYNCLETEECGSGFKIINDVEEDERIRATDDVSYYTLDMVQVKNTPDIEGVQEAIDHYHNLFEFYFMDNQLVMIIQQYTP